MQHHGGSPVDLVRARLERGGRITQDSGDHFMAHCPAHEGRTPKLHVSTGANGRALLTCHRGCTTQAILDELGLAWRDLFQQPAPTLPSRERARTGQGCKEARTQGQNVAEVERGPSVGSNESEVEALLQLEADGVAEPLLGERLWLPDDATVPMQMVAAFFERVRGLRRWADMPAADEVPFAYRWVAGHVGLPPRTTGQALNRLRQAGVLEAVGELDRRPGMTRGTLVFRAMPLGAEQPEAAFPAVAGRVEADDAGRVDEREVVGDDAAVRGAVADDRGEVLEGGGGLGAAVAGAAESGHAIDHNGASGCAPRNAIHSWD